MNKAFAPRLDALPPPQRWLWPRLSAVTKLGMVLYGGTAIALRLGHRVSVDFDFFADRPLDKTQLRAAVPFVAASTVLQDQPDTLTVLTPAGEMQQSTVKVSFFGNLDMGRVGEPQLTGDGVLQVASADDLLATKLKVLLQRVELKDYRDIVALIVAGASLEYGLAAARAMYGKQFQPSECLKALVYFQGGELSQLSQYDREVLVETVSAVRDLPTVLIRNRALALVDV